MAEGSAPKLMKKICVIFGTRPEAIKLAPLVLLLKSDPRFDCQVCVTAQHRQMLDQVLELFGIIPDADLNVMRSDQTLGQLTSRLVACLDEYLRQERPDLVLVQGDTTTVFCAALAAFYHKVPVGHVEAGLRTGNMEAPWPEEANRVLTSRLATLHFAPTKIGRQNLLGEGVNPERIFVTGNTVIDALLWVRNRLHTRDDCDSRVGFPVGVSKEFARRFLASAAITPIPGQAAKFILVTGHRRESFGQGFENICLAIRELTEKYPDLGVVYPVHLNPNVQGPVQRILGNHPRVQLVAPLSYEPFIWLMERADFILTDSGGVQEEAPSLGKPVLVMRDTTERPEGMAAGTCRLVGTAQESIVAEASRLLEDRKEYQRRSRLKNPYGDGKAAERIVENCATFLGDSKTM
jgi:UDP-N-acetylglucosamine 2-epimerase (non-hydrolysing)